MQNNMPNTTAGGSYINPQLDTAESIGHQQQSNSVIKMPTFNKGGSVSETRALLKEGGMMDEGGTVDPISGNEVPTGAMKEEVRDDVPAQLSEGEFVIPADVVRYIGLERLMMMRQAAKEGLKKMEQMGQMSNAEEATMEDDSEFESEIDDILSELDSEEGEDKEEVKMANGGMVDQTQQALAQGQQPQQPQVPALTEEQLAFIQKTAEGMKAQQVEVAPEQQSMPTEGLKSSDIIRSNLTQSRSPEETDAFMNKVARLEKTAKMINIRHNDTVVLGFVKAPGVVDPIVFTQDDPARMQQAIDAAFSTAKQSGIKRLESSTPNPQVVEALKAQGYAVEETPTGWGLNL